ncbi:MAG: pilus assembly protein, partial [Planctomycetes bacterium]|nr:pilus assembly protein [Planctomycetota bacterium]
AARQNSSWFSSNMAAWTSATQNISDATTGLRNGNFRLPNNMYLANNGQAMIDGLNAAFQKIADDISGSGGSFASNSTKLEVGSRTYQAMYMSNGWGGRLIASDVNVTTGNLTNRWDASDWLGHAAGQLKVNADADDLVYTDRKILFHDPAAASKLTSFIDSDTGTITRPTAWSSTSTISNEQLRYVLGDRLHERQSVNPSSDRKFRNRRGMLGDIINSQPVYVGKPNANLYSGDTTYAAFATAQAGRDPVVYVGANDGMLHAFYAPDASETAEAADGGKELFAFMPTTAMGVLTQHDPSSNKYPYWHPEYDHAYSVDGEITVADVKINNAWATVLVGSMGRGGRGLYALDVTDPANPVLLWEKSATDIPQLGNVLGRPLVARVGTNDWRVFLGNGPNNNNDQAALIILDVDDGDATVVGTEAGSEGLSAVNVWDAGGVAEGDPRDGLFDTVYAGDMGGNMWKFDLTTSPVSRTKLFAAGATQPITAAPLVASNPYSPPETWLFFGTGQYLSMADINEDANQDVQSWYGIIDRNATVAKADLNQVRITHQDSVGRVIERAGNVGDDQDGWYINLQSPEEAAADSTVPARGERMVLPNFFQGYVLIGTTRFPDSTDPCAPAGKGFTMAIDPFTGGRLSNPFFDIDGDGTVGDEGDLYDGDTDTPYSGVAYDSGPNNPIFLGEYMYTSLDDGSYSQLKTGSGAASIKRVSWRELLNGM